VYIVSFFDENILPIVMKFNLVISNNIEKKKMVNTIV